MHKKRVNKGKYYLVVVLSTLVYATSFGQCNSDSLSDCKMKLYEALELENSMLTDLKSTVDQPLEIQSKKRVYFNVEHDLVVDFINNSIIQINRNLHFDYLFELDSIAFNAEENLLILFSKEFSIGNSGTSSNWAVFTTSTTFVWLDKQKQITFGTYYAYESETYNILEEIEGEMDDTYLGEKTVAQIVISPIVFKDTLLLQGTVERHCYGQLYSEEDGNYIKSNDTCMESLSRSYAITQKGIIEIVEK